MWGLEEQITIRHGAREPGNKPASWKADLIAFEIAARGA